MGLFSSFLAAYNQGRLKFRSLPKRLDQRLSTFCGPWMIFKTIFYGQLCYADTSWPTSWKEVSERFIKDLWNSLWITRNSRWATADPPGPGWESLAQMTLSFLFYVLSTKPFRIIFLLFKLRHRTDNVEQRKQL